jgi:acetyltransferase-like isoleucine patch superfamily enzyme
MYLEPAKIDPAVIERKRAAAPGLKVRPPLVYVLNDEGRIIDVETEGIDFWNKLAKWLGQWAFNTVISFIPSHALRLAWLRKFGATIGRGSTVMRGVFVQDAFNLTIGDNTTIGPRCVLDGRSGIWIGDNVTIDGDVQLLAGGHDINHPDFPIVGPDPTVIEDHVWIGHRAMALPCHIKRGAVVEAHALIIKDIGELEIVSGNPAKPVGKRDPAALRYSAKYRPLCY